MFNEKNSESMERRASGWDLSLGGRRLHQKGTLKPDPVPQAGEWGPSDRTPCGSSRRGPSAPARRGSWGVCAPGLHPHGQGRENMETQ